MGFTGGFSNTTMNGVLQLIKFSLELADLKSGYGVTPEDMVFRDKMYQVPTFSIITDEKNYSHLLKYTDNYDGGIY